MMSEPEAARELAARTVDLIVHLLARNGPDWPRRALGEAMIERGAALVAEAVGPDEAARCLRRFGAAIATWTPSGRA
jgi:hypothetical protein